MHVTEMVLAGMLWILVLFQIALALGAPWGEAAWGGRYKNKLPTNLRVASLLSAVSLLFMSVVVLSVAGGVELYPELFTTAIIWVMAVYFAIGVVMNALSRSKVERIWAPYSAILSILCFLIVL